MLQLLTVSDSRSKNGVSKAVESLCEFCKLEMIFHLKDQMLYTSSKFRLKIVVIALFQCALVRSGLNSDTDDTIVLYVLAMLFLAFCELELCVSETVLWEDLCLGKNAWIKWVTVQKNSQTFTLKILVIHWMMKSSDNCLIGMEKSSVARFDFLNSVCKIHWYRQIVQ